MILNPVGNDELKPIRIVALDLDGTTFDSQGQLSERTKGVLEEAARRGVHIVVSTGRAYASLPEHIKAVEGVEYAITSNGAHINDIRTGEQLYSEFLSMSAIDDVIRISKKYSADLEVFIDGTAYVDISYYRSVEENGCKFRNAEYVLWSRKPVPDIVKLLLDNSDKIENINIVIDDLEILAVAREEVQLIDNARTTSSFKNNLEVGGPNASKRIALEELLRRLDLTREELMCCGDAPNDIEMIELAGIGVAMGNAWGGVKDHADYITGTNDEDGVAQAIEKFVFL